MHGAGIFVQRCTMSSKGDVYFINNSAEFGGGLKSLESTVYVQENGTLEFISNSASKIGGAILVNILAQI